MLPSLQFKLPLTFNNDQHHSNFFPAFATLTLSLQHNERIKTSIDFTMWCSFLTSSGSPNPIPLYPKITLDRQREHCITCALPGRLVCCLSESRLIIHIPGLLRGTRRCGWKQGRMWGSGLGYWGSAFFLAVWCISWKKKQKKLSHRGERRWHRFWLEKQDKGLISSQHRNKINKPLRFQDTADSHYLCLYDSVTGV